MKIAAYCRVSTDKADQLNSLEAQKEFFSEYTQRTAASTERKNAALCRILPKAGKQLLWHAMQKGLPLQLRDQRSDRGDKRRGVQEMPSEPGVLDTALSPDLSEGIWSSADHGGK